MAVCTLDLGNPCFIASCGKQQDDQDFKDGPRELHAKVEENHLSCNRVVQKFWGNKKFIHLQNKIWKYDWARTGNSSAGRKA